MASLFPGAPAAPGAPPRQGFSLLNDEPLTDRTQDLLSSYQAAGALTRLLTDSRTATPFTLAVDAGWGMGKSSLMRLVDARLREFPEIRTVWYNAWSSTGPDALEGLIKSVLSQVDRNVLRRWVRRLRDGGAATALLRALTVLAAGPLGVSAMVDELWRRLSADAGARNGMRDALRGLVGEWTASVGGTRGRLLVIFIDDLDRCGEDTFLAVCEAVKVYLDVPGLAFVIGCDRSAVGPAGLLRDLSPAGTAFAEKIFQTSYRIPAPSGPDIRAYVRSCARQAGIDAMLDDHLVELLAYRAARNPRRVKRLLNGLLLEASLNPIWAGVRPEAVIRTLLLQYLYPDFYRMMTTPAGPGDGDVVREFRTYRSVRGHLWRGEPWTEDVTREVGGFLRAYSLPPLPSYPSEPGGRPRSLTTLEQLLPTDFPGLANDPAFVSLVDELVALPESQLVLRRLREGMDQPLEAEPAGPAPGHLPTPPPYGTDGPYGSPYESPYGVPSYGGSPYGSPYGPSYGYPQQGYGFPQPAQPQPQPEQPAHPAYPPPSDPWSPPTGPAPAGDPGPAALPVPEEAPGGTVPAGVRHLEEAGRTERVERLERPAEPEEPAEPEDAVPEDAVPEDAVPADAGSEERAGDTVEVPADPTPPPWYPGDPAPAVPPQSGAKRKPARPVYPGPEQEAYPQAVPPGYGGSAPSGYQSPSYPMAGYPAPAPGYQSPSYPSPGYPGAGYPASVSPALEEESGAAADPGAPLDWYGQRPLSPRPQEPAGSGPSLPVRLVGFRAATGAKLTDDLARLGVTARADRGPLASQPLGPAASVVTVCHVDSLDQPTAARFAELRRPVPAGALPGLVLYSPRLTPVVEGAADRLRAEVTDDLARVVAAAYALAVGAPRPGGPFSSPYGQAPGGPSGPAAPPSAGPRP